MQGVGFIQGLLLSTWQKVGPFIILLKVAEKVKRYLLVRMGCLSVLAGGWGGLNQVQMRKIIAYSSISHLGWICGVVTYSSYIGCVMFVVYVVIRTGVILIKKEIGLYNLSFLGRLVYYNPWSGILLLSLILSLGGLPPFTGFLKKFIGLECLLLKKLIVPCAILIVGRLLRLFFYLRIGFKRALSLFPQHSLVMLA